MSYAWQRRVREAAPAVTSGGYGWFRLCVPAAPAPEGPPEGYRLLRFSDLGKEFGTELDAHLWIDSAAAENCPVSDLSGEFVRIERPDGSGYLLYHLLHLRAYTSYPPLDKSNLLGVFTADDPSAASALRAVDLTGYSVKWCESREWNTWLYVRYIGEGEDVDDTIIVVEGNCGAEDDNLRYTLYSNGMMVITGSGAMADYTLTTACNGTNSNAPWNSNRLQITALHVTSEVTHIGNNAFYGATNLSAVVLPEGISIGTDAFSGTAYLSQGGTA